MHASRGRNLVDQHLGFAAAIVLGLLLGINLLRTWQPGLQAATAFCLTIALVHFNSQGVTAWLYGQTVPNLVMKNLIDEAAAYIDKTGHPVAVQFEPTVWVQGYGLLAGLYQADKTFSTQPRWNLMLGYKVPNANGETVLELVTDGQGGARLVYPSSSTN